MNIRGRIISFSIVSSMILLSYSSMITAYTDPVPESSESRAGTLDSPLRDWKEIFEALQAVSTNFTDTDNDGIYDSVERVLGTDPEYGDSDFDGLTDGYEVQRDMSPLDADINDDGLPDNHEVFNKSLDHDKDGILNPWDEDNDNDGVPDGTDISPFARSSFGDNFEINITPTGKPIEINFQIRTEDPDHLKLYSQYWNWPKDETGSMNDLDDSEKDVTVVPSLVLESTHTPSEELMTDLGIIETSDGLMVPLVSVRENGQIVGFGGKIAFQGISADHIDINARLLWRVHGLSDVEIHGFELTDGRRMTIDEDGSVIAREGEADDSNSFIIEKQQDDRIAIRTIDGRYLTVLENGMLEASETEITDSGLFTIKENVDIVTLVDHRDRNLSVTPGGIFRIDGSGLAVEMKHLDLGYRSLVVLLRDYWDRFSISGMDIYEDHGAEAGVFFSDKGNMTMGGHMAMAFEYLRNSSNSLSDTDFIFENYNITDVEKRIKQSSTKVEAVDDLINNLIPSAIGNMTVDDMVPLTIAIGDRYRNFDLSDLSPSSGITGSNVKAPMASGDVIETRSLKMNWYDTKNDTLHDDKGALDCINTISPKGSLNNDYLSVLLSWSYGETETFGDPIKDFNYDFGQITEIADKDISVKDIIDFASGVAELPSELRICWYEYRFPSKVTSRFWALDQNGNARYLYEMDQVSKFGPKDVPKGMLKEQMKSKSVRNSERFGNAMAQFAVIVESVAVGIALYSILSCSDLNPMMLDYFLTMTFMEYLFNMMIVMIGLIPYVGWIISLLISISDAIAGWSGKLFKRILDSMISVKDRVTPSAAILSPPRITTYDLDNSGPGLDVGDRIEYRINVSGNVSGNNWGIVSKSDNYPFYNVSNWDPNAKYGYLFSPLVPNDPSYNGYGYYAAPYNQSTRVVTYNTPNDNISGLPYWKNISYETGVWLEPGTPMVNYPMTLQLKTHYELYYTYDVFYFFVFYWCTRTHTGVSRGLSNLGDPVTLYYDIMPDSLNNFASWRSLKPLDSDLDGIENSNEVNSSKDKSDTDGDGLSDKYEEDIGYDPSVPDQDLDGLSDLTEHDLRTNATMNDTDGDGLTDYVEVKGWVINFTYCGEIFYWHIRSDPLINDTDGDGLLDNIEFLCLLNPRSRDTDGDGNDDELLDYYTTEIEFDASFEYTGYVGPIDNMVYFYDDDIAVDRWGNIYLVNGNSSLTKLDTNGSFMQEFNEGYGFKSLSSLDIDDEGYIFVGDIKGYYNQTIVYLLNPDGTLNNSWGEQDLWEAKEIDVDIQGDIHVLGVGEGEDYWLVEFARNGTVLSKTLFLSGSQGGEIEYYPEGLAVDSRGYRYISDTVSDRIYIVDPDGNITYIWEDPGTGIGQFTAPKDIYIDSDDYIYLCDSGNQRVQKFDKYRRPVAWFGAEGTGNGEYSDLFSICVGEDDVIYTGDYDPIGNVSRIQVLGQNITFHEAEDDIEFVDTDQDGLEDIQEEAGWTVVALLPTGTVEYSVVSDPLLNDTDQDGLSDFEEFTYSSDPSSTDTDKDSIPDLMEIQQGTNIVSFDSDGDLLDDGTESSFGSDPLEKDTEHDGVDDKTEYIYGTRPDSGDTDFDGVDDKFEITSGSAPCDPDSDGDNVFDKVEFDDGTNPVFGDSDLDGLDDGFEKLFMTNPLSSDTDMDGLPDLNEIKLFLNPLINDTDMDGLLDMYEIDLGTNPRSNDTDGDGVLDGVDIDSLASIVGNVTICYDDEELTDLMAVIGSYIDLVPVDPMRLKEDHGNDEKILLLGSSDKTGDTWGLIEELEAGGIGEGSHMGSDFGIRFGVWSEKQTVVWIKDPNDLDIPRILQSFRGRTITLKESGYEIDYYSNKTTLNSYLPDLLKVSSLLSNIELEGPRTARMEVETRSYAGDAPALGVESGMFYDDLPLDRYIDIDLIDTSPEGLEDPVRGAYIEFYYTEDDLDPDGDGEDLLNEENLSVYHLNGSSGRWEKMKDSMEWVYGMGVNTTDVSLMGFDYAGMIWISVDRLCSFALAGERIDGVEPLPCVADCGPDLTIYAGETVFFNGSGSSGNIRILNFTWSFEYDGTPVELFGANPWFKFDMPGIYDVTLSILDGYSFTATDMMTVTVLEAEPQFFILRVGPIMNVSDIAIEGANVTLDFGDLFYYNLTDDQGFATFELPVSLLGSEVDVIIKAEGYKELRYSTRINENGTLDMAPARLEKEEASPPPLGDGKEKGFPWGVVILIVVLSILLLIAVSQFVIRKKLGKAPDEIEEE
ncbi:MAG: PKD domain-containing protein [Thermoplasmatota archaeon]